MTYVDGIPDFDRQETEEWADSLRAVVDERGKARARYLLGYLIDEAARLEVAFPPPMSTPYLNTLPPSDAPYPGDEDIEARIEALIRWNAAVMVTRANAAASSLGGHLSTYASSATLYEVGFQHFFRGKDGGEAGDQIYFQGHATPGIYARAYLEGRLDEDDLDHFRREVRRDAGRCGLSSYPHPRLMPELWEFPTVSMGLGPINAIYQARFNRYLQNRGITDTSASKVWCFLGDGECDEPESLGALSVAAREPLDNLIFVVNCNLQRLDGPVRGNGKVIQELESLFTGAGWNVIKLVWGTGWDDVLADDSTGVLLDRLTHTVDGEFQKYAVEHGGYFRDRFFDDPELARLVEHLSDEQLNALCWGGHDRRKVYQAYEAAVSFESAPTVVLAKTVKGHALGSEIAGRNATHQIKKMEKAQLGRMRDLLSLGDLVSDDDLEGDAPLYRRWADGSPEAEYLKDRRRHLGGAVPRRVVGPARLGQPDAAAFEQFTGGSDGRSVSTTMAFAMLLKNLLRDDAIGKRIVPIIPDEGRTFGLDSLFSQVHIYAPTGQRYEPVDAGMQLSYKESRTGQIMEEGITEAGSMGSFTAAGTAYATWGEPMIPFFMFYSMFGFQRVGDLIWAFGDQRGRGFLLGATAGRTTLNGEGLQHEDGHSLVLASTVPNLAAYDPAFAYEVAEIVRDGIARMYGEDPEDVFYYLTLYNENYEMPPMPDNAAEGIVRGIYRFAEAPSVEGDDPRRATILFSGTGQGAAREAQSLLAERYGVAAELWSVTSYKALREDALEAERWNRLHPGEAKRTPYVTRALEGSEGPVVAVTDFMKLVPDQVARWVPGHFVPLGTDGYGRSDTREVLRRHFETDAAHVTVAVLDALAATGEGKPEEVGEAIAAFGIDPEALDPLRA